MTIGVETAPQAKVLLYSTSVPLAHKMHVLRTLAVDGGEAAVGVLAEVLQDAMSNTGEERLAETIAEYEQLIAQLKAGALHPGEFLELSDVDGPGVRARIIFRDGSEKHVLVPDPELAASLQPGETVLLEAQGKAVLARSSSGTSVGDVARFVRRIDERRVEVELREGESSICWAAWSLIGKLDRGEVSPDQGLLVSSRQGLALDAVPPNDGVNHFRYLDRNPVPDVIVERDVADPPAYIRQLTEMIWDEMTVPELRRRYNLRSTSTRLLVGVSGSGKTLSIDAFVRSVYEAVSAIVGVPVEELPPRVMRLVVSRILSKWLGESDSHLDRFWDELAQLAAEPLVLPDGTSFLLPAIAIFEECDALARTRGTDHEAVFDRIQTTILRRLDARDPGLANGIIVCLFTSNVPELLDPAFVRRAGGQVVRFGRLQTRRAAAAVLRKHLDKVPCAATDGRKQEQAAEELVQEVAGWLFHQNGQSLAELDLAGSPEPLRLFRRNFLTGGLVDRAVQQAAEEACRQEKAGCDDPGVSFQVMAEALQGQIDGVVQRLTKDNVRNYADLPDGAHVVGVRRTKTPAVAAAQLLRRTHS